MYREREHKHGELQRERVTKHRASSQDLETITQAKGRRPTG